MDYIVNQKQLVMVIDKLLNMEGLIRIDSKDDLFLVKNENDEYAIMVYQKKAKRLYFKKSILDLIIKFFNQNHYHAIQFIINWFQSNYNFKILRHWIVDDMEKGLLRRNYSIRTKQ